MADARPIEAQWTAPMTQTCPQIREAEASSGVIGGGLGRSQLAEGVLRELNLLDFRRGMWSSACLAKLWRVCWRCVCKVRAGVCQLTQDTGAGPRIQSVSVHAPQCYHHHRHTPPQGESFVHTNSSARFRVLGLISLLFTGADRPLGKHVSKKNYFYVDLICY